MAADNAHPSTSSNSQTKLEFKYSLKDVDYPLGSEYHLMTVEEVLENAKEITDFLVYYHGLENVGEDIVGEYMDELQGEETQALEFLLYKDYKDDNIVGMYIVDGCSCMVHEHEKSGLKRVLVDEKKVSDPTSSNSQNGGLIKKPKGYDQVSFPGGLRMFTKDVKLYDDDYDFIDESDDDDDYDNIDDDEGNFLRSSIDVEIPEGYGLASLEELKFCITNHIRFLVKETKLQVDGSNKDLWLVLRKIGRLREGEDRDIQDVSHNEYFLYGGDPGLEPRIRLKNGFIDMHRRLVWKEFSKHNIIYVLGVNGENIKHETKLEDKDKVVALLFSCLLESHEEIAELKRDPNYLNIMKENNPNAPRGGSAIHLCAEEGANIMTVDKEGQNALHRVCALPRDNYDICIILKECHDQSAKSTWSKYVCSQNFYGQNALHIAAKAGNVKIVDFLLNSADKNVIGKLIKMRDYNGQTIFHYVATRPRGFQVEANAKLDVVKKIWTKAEEISKGTSKKDLPLIIWSVGEGVGLADEWATNNKYSEIANYLDDKRKNCKENLLGLALEYNNFDMVLELINRGAVITKQMRRHAEKAKLKIEDWESKSEGKPTLDKIKELESMMLSHQGRTTDQPTDEDLLEREDIKSSISALLLNQHMGSPITLGILGGNGMGKSSMMLQVEHNLLSRAATETLRLALSKDDIIPNSESSFTGAKKDSLRSKRYSKKLLSELKQVIQKIEYNKKDYVFDKEAIDLEKSNELERKSKCIWNSSLEYLSKPFKRIKAMIVSTFGCKVLPQEEKIDNYITNFNEDNKWLVKRLALASDGEEVSALMTVRFDAWQYENQDEAWAGMAIEILKEMESSMTKAQLLYASVMYSIKRNQSYARIHWMLPIIGYLVLGVIVGFISYILLSIPKSPYAKPLKYGSIIVTIFLAVWRVLSQITEYAKPISDKLVESTKSLQEQHLTKVGYQHQVIDDINFLKGCMTCRDIPMLFLWQLLAYILNIQSGSTFLASSMEASDALKNIPSKEYFRIIVFIDNLDRHKEQLFTPVNMILKSCDINAVVAMDKEVVDEMFATEPKQSVKEATELEQSVKDNGKQRGTTAQKEALITQLIQIPIVLPEPDVHELNNTFLTSHLKDMGKKKKTEPNSNKDIIKETKEHASLHQVTCLSVEISPTSDSLPSEYNVVKTSLQSLQPSQEISIETEEHLRQSIESSPTNDNLPREYEMVRKCIHAAQPPQEETNEEKQKAWRDMKINVLDSNYSSGEIEIFRKLSKHTYGYYRSPRAWKSLLNYHRLIRSLLTYDKHILEVKAWKRQLVIWVFFCWQWKHEMNEIFKNWQDLTSVPLEELKYDSSLVDIKYQKPLVKVLKNDYPLIMLKKKHNEDLWDIINNIYLTLSDLVLRFPSTGQEYSWSRLSQALSHGDIDLNMQCMLAFQKYRFDCKPGALTLCIS